MSYFRHLLKFIICCSFVLLAVQGVSAEERLTVTQAVARNIAPGDTQKFSISLNDGDYVGISIRQHGKVNLTI